MICEIEGEVVKGKQIGRTLGFPTANVREDDPVTVKYGVYAGRIYFDGEEHYCVVNIGRHPTLPEGDPTIEAHILDFSGDLYFKRVRLELEAFMREETRFDSLDALKSQLKADCERARGLAQ